MGVLRWAGWLFVGVMAVSVVKCAEKESQKAKQEVAELKRKASLSPTEKEREEKVEAEIAQREKVQATREARLNDARWHCKQFVTQQLRSPTTANFQNYRDFSAREMTDNVFLVGGHVDAQNAFGAVVRQNFICELITNADGSHWSGTKISILP